MPDLGTSLHVDMLEQYQRARSWPRRVLGAIRGLRAPDFYGSEWGDPETVPPLRFIRDRWVTPYVRPDQTGLEIGPGGGRWTRYLLNFERLYVVDFYPELLAEFRRTHSQRNIVPIRNNGTDFPSVPDGAIDYLFSFGVFVHLDAPLIEGYLDNMRSVLKPGGNAVIHYSDMNKVMAQALRPNFSENDPETMRAMVTKAGFRVLEEDLTTLWHSSLIRFTQ